MTDLLHYVTARRWLDDIIGRMTAWHVNEGLAPLLAQERAAHPGIDIGTIGDTAHQTEHSDHNPNAAGRVNAADFMLNTAFTETDALALLPWLIKDARTHYVIHDRKIWTSEIPSWKPYVDKNGKPMPDPHTNHIHLSVKDSAHTNTRPWVITKTEDDDVNVDGLLVDANANKRKTKPDTPPDTPLGHYALSQQVEDGTDSDNLTEFYKAFANLGHLVVTLSKQVSALTAKVDELTPTP